MRFRVTRSPTIKKNKKIFEKNKKQPPPFYTASVGTRMCVCLCVSSSVLSRAAAAAARYYYFHVRCVRVRGVRCRRVTMTRAMCARARQYDISTCVFWRRRIHFRLLFVCIINTHLLVYSSRYNNYNNNNNNYNNTRGKRLEKKKKNIAFTRAYNFLV